jgi:hypothetical protein
MGMVMGMVMVMAAPELQLKTSEWMPVPKQWSNAMKIAIS